MCNGRAPPDRTQISALVWFWCLRCFWSHVGVCLILPACRLKPLRYRLGVCLFDWLLILLDFMFPFLGPSLTVSACYLIAKSLLFLSTLSYCGVRVLLVLQQPGPGDGSRSAVSWSAMKRKAFKVIVITLGFNSATQLLQILMLGPTVLTASLLLILQLTLFALSISITSSFITPLLFLHRARKLPCINF